MDTFQKCAAADAYPLKTAAQGMEGILPFLGYLQAFQHENRQFYVVPKDVRAIYQELATASFLARKKRDNLIHSYAMAAVNLYGVIRQDDLITIFNSQNSKKLAEAELFPHPAPAHRLNVRLCAMGGILSPSRLRGK